MTRLKALAAIAATAVFGLSTVAHAASHPEHREPHRGHHSHYTAPVAGPVVHPYFNQLDANTQAAERFQDEMKNY
jgi:Spy/CpxP family protein refolding chaperone